MQAPSELIAVEIRKDANKLRPPCETILLKAEQVINLYKFVDLVEAEKIYILDHELQGILNNTNRTHRSSNRSTILRKQTRY